MSSRAMASHLGCVIEPAGEFLKSWYPAHTLDQLKVSSCQCFQSLEYFRGRELRCGPCPSNALCQAPPRAWPPNCMRQEARLTGSRGCCHCVSSGPHCACPPNSPRRLPGARQHCRRAHPEPSSGSTLGRGLWVICVHTKGRQNIWDTCRGRCRAWATLSGQRGVTGRAQFLEMYNSLTTLENWDF